MHMRLPTEASSPRDNSERASDFIDFDVPCAQCGYNLRTLHASGVCPECEHRILSSIDEHLRRRLSRFELARLRDRPLASVRSIRVGACYAIFANALMLSVIHFPAWMFKRHSNWRTGMLILVCIALASAAMSIWHFAVRPRSDRAIGLGPQLLRAGAVGAVAYPVLVTLTNDYQTFGLSWLHTEVPYYLLPAAWAMAIGISLRLGYAQWWLRLEGWPVLGWSLLLCVLPLAFFYVFLAPFQIQTFYRGDFVGLDFFMEVPLASGCWPVAFTECEAMLGRGYYRYGRPETLMAMAVIVGQCVVFMGDAALAWLATRDINARRSSANDDGAGFPR